jgi:hypothetical protein
MRPRLTLLLMLLAAAAAAGCWLLLADAADVIATRVSTKATDGSDSGSFWRSPAAAALTVCFARRFDHGVRPTQNRAHPSHRASLKPRGCRRFRGLRDNH